MFPHIYFAGSYFSPTYFPPSGHRGTGTLIGLVIDVYQPVQTVHGNASNIVKITGGF